jgi:hypothetical protein
MSTKQTTITVPCRNRTETATVATRWRGRELAVHPPIKIDGNRPAFAEKIRGVWYDVPTIAECMEWTVGGMAETPDGRTVEPDDSDSWLALLGVV